MGKTKYVRGLLLLIAVLIAMGGIVGCGEGESRRASKALMKDLVTAQRLYDRALALLANPVYVVKDKDTDETPPFSKIPLEDQIEPRSPMTLRCVLDVPPPIVLAIELMRPPTQLTRRSGRGASGARTALGARSP